jgi:transposase
VWFQDEARIGQKNKITRRWARRGTRPSRPRLAAGRHRRHGQSRQHHKGAAVRQAIRSAGAKLFFLPKYSPDLNPIEQVFAKCKHLLRNAAARNFDTVCAAIGQLLDSFTPAECANYFANSLEPENIPLECGQGPAV